MNLIDKDRVHPYGPKDTDHPALVAAKKELLGTDNTTTLEQDLFELFCQIDTDKSGSLDLNEVVLFFKAITDDISQENVKRVFKKLDGGNQEALDFAKFKVRKIVHL